MRLFNPSGETPTLNPITAGKWKMNDLLTVLGFASTKANATKMMKAGHVKVNGEAPETQYLIDAHGIELTVNDLTFRVIGG